MKAHAVHGERIIANTFLSNKAEVASIVRHHHEAFNGSGYPDGLARENIPLSSRIILIVDSYDAMTTTRPYRKALTHNQAMDILAEETGTKVDPQIFTVFSEVIENSLVRSF